MKLRKENNSQPNPERMELPEDWDRTDVKLLKISMIFSREANLSPIVGMDIDSARIFYDTDSPLLTFILSTI